MKGTVFDRTWVGAENSKQMNVEKWDIQIAFTLAMNHISMQKQTGLSGRPNTKVHVEFEPAYSSTNLAKTGNLTIANCSCATKHNFIVILQQSGEKIRPIGTPKPETN